LTVKPLQGLMLTVVKAFRAAKVGNLFLKK
jgi:hypothetical protein